MTEKEKEMLLSSLAYFKMKIENHPYPSYEFKRGAIVPELINQPNEKKE